MANSKKENIRSVLNSFSTNGSLEFKEDYPLSRCCTFRIGGPADFAVYPKSCECLAELCIQLKKADARFMVLGNASNILFSDRGYRGAVIFTSQLNGVCVSGSLIRAECGVSLSHLAVCAANKGLSGLEFAYGIPGTCGGGIYMNAGAYGGEMSQIVKESVYFVPATGVVMTIDNLSHGFGYRESIYSKTDNVIMSAVFSLNYGNEEQIRSQMEEYSRRRRESQPLEYPSAGSTFKRCEGRYTAQLIDNAGLKGFSVGGAQVSPKHAGFIINRGDATAEDVKRLIEIIRREIYRIDQIDIQPEIKMLDE